MTHLLVTNDYPPKVGGIQSYLYELWRRLPPERVSVLTLDHRQAKVFDVGVSHRIERLQHSVLLPTRALRVAIDAFARDVGASIVLLDPALPVGVLGPHLELPYGLILHGAEVTVPARLPGAKVLLKKTLLGAKLVVSAGEYAAREARRLTAGQMKNLVVVPPGVDTNRFAPLSPNERDAARRHFGLSLSSLLVVSVSRLVPRKGMDVLIEAAARLSNDHDDLEVVVAGEGRDKKRLQRLILSTGAPVRLLGKVSDADLPLLYGMSDVMTMLCRNRWLGLEQEGFGMVFLEAAACGIAQVAGMSGGADEAVEDEVSGLVVDRPADVVVATKALRQLLENEQLRDRLGKQARERVVESFTYDALSRRLEAALIAVGG